MFEQLHAGEEGGESSAEPGEGMSSIISHISKLRFLITGKKRQTRGGRAIPKIKAKKAVDRCVGIARASRGKKKFVTVVTGLSTYDVDLKVFIFLNCSVLHKFCCLNRKPLNTLPESLPVAHQ